MGASLTLCCCHFFLKYNREKKKPLLRMNTAKTSNTPMTPEKLSSESSDTEEENQFDQQLTTRTPLTTQRTNRHSASRRRESDRELQAFISMRNQVDQATEEWEQLNFDIHTLRYAKREVRARWKKILLQLGYQSEVDTLLYVNKQNYLNRDQESLTRATELLTQLLEHTSLFPAGTGHRTRYLYVMDRLVSLDSADEFVRLAMEKYPKAATLELTTENGSE
ncbi:melanoregulin-like [Corythoichthys intestinalis]|uniref:melanoregulin-like n=1 Tax=Corythoichthys intestinalis TaxID=161448 RepID=UPI0025A50DEB|nr:melanoregulin-like [Corythoichthys intestinalis]XP_061799745.1 melanoregulin-like [Nerophis lumbriciformis]